MTYDAPTDYLVNHRRIAALTAERDAAHAKLDELTTTMALMDVLEPYDEGYHGAAQALRSAMGLPALPWKDPPEDDARRSGLTLTAEERAALEWALQSVTASRASRYHGGADVTRDDEVRNTIDRLLAGARTVTEAAPLHPMAEDGSGPTTGTVTEPTAEAYRNAVAPLVERLRQVRNSGTVHRRDTDHERAVIDILAADAAARGGA